MVDRYQDDLGGPTTASEEANMREARDFGDDWVHEVIAMTRPGIEIEFPVRAINEREIPFVYDDFS
ncbi:hypothetical protein [uncultured Sphingomonas sp.]|uniref:hypothetical protein n=1 Tax=uncultured Sphingomonas sp. TaxID=158754 RepID=UPI0035C96D1B